MVSHKDKKAVQADDPWGGIDLVDIRKMLYSFERKLIMGSTRKSFTPEYRANAVSLVIDDHRTITDVARGIDMNHKR
jgi:hypothetical protein